MTTQTQTKSTRRGEAGNVLFLILIAVALFAALSYAVTQSTRSGGGDASKEKNLVSSAALTQYPASLKTAITRMLISNGVDLANLTFDPPSSFSTLNDSTPALSTKNNVFHPTGGGATYTTAPVDVMATNAAGTWVFNARNRVANVGSDTADATGVDIVALLPNVSQGICNKIHEQLGIGAVPTLTGVEVANPKISTAPNITYTAGNVIGNLSGANVLNGQPQGCFQQPANTYYYYHVLVER